MISAGTRPIEIGPPPGLGFTIVSALRADARALRRHAASAAGEREEIGPLERLVRAPGPWEHERVVTADGAGARVTDRVWLAPSAATPGIAAWALTRAIFARRHRWLRRRFGTRPFRVDLETPRLWLRPWEPADRARLTALAGDPRIARWLAGGRPWTAAETGAFLRRQRRLLAARGVCLGAVIERATGDVVGLGGVQPFEATSDLQLAWWLDPSRWGRGYATEIGAAALRFAFAVAGARRVIAVARPENRRSIAVMARLGMRRARWVASDALALHEPAPPLVAYVREWDEPGAAPPAAGFTPPPRSE